MTPLTWTIITFSLFTSTVIVMASYNWMLEWLALELNTLSIIPIIIKTHHPRSTEAATKYFLIQAAAAAVILLSGTLNTWQTGQWSLARISPLATTTSMLAILMKLGLAPFHFWYPQVLPGSNMLTALTISTWPKIAPLTRLYVITQTPSTNMLILGLTSALIGGWLGLNQTQTRKLMAFSSIAHMGWLVTALTLNPKLATLTLIIYIFMTTTVFMTLAPTETKTMPDFSTLHSCHPTTTSLMLLALLSLGGLPPLSGFMPKWLILNELVTKDLLLLSTLLALASLPSLFFYTRMTYVTTLTTPPNNPLTEHKWRLKSNFSMSLMTTAPLATMLLPITPILINTL
uniref:NADH-ubiquinone oxidoreductase chain 2 n=1 Tax=Lygodactylus graniticolus TaxID=1537662 RepID=A0A077GYM6_9SAUR|nr:NADH dehydrogenase subunit 2 [Lygodactylus graniticolus]